MIACRWCGAQNYAIDSWCSKCQHHLDFGPPHRPANRRASRWSLLAPLAAALGVAMAMALPAASWFDGSRATLPPTLPQTAVLPPTPSPSADSTPSAPPEATPTDEASPAPEPSATEQPAPIPAPTIRRPAVPAVGDPVAAVRRFYQAVSAHEFDRAAALWSPQMQAEFPPAEYIDQRFAATRRIDLRTERLVAAGGGVAVVYVDIIEVIGGQTRHWAGTWQLIDSPSGWLLNRPDLGAAA
jgi:hypothetical protein